MSKTTAFTIWVFTCVSIGLILAAADGVSPIGIIKTALLVAVIMIVGLSVTALVRKIRVKKRD